MNQHDEQPQLNALDGERGIPSVNQRGPSTKMRALIVIVLLLILGLAVGGWLWAEKKKAQKQAEAAEEASKRGMVSSVPSRSFTEPPAAKAPPSAPPALPGPDKADAATSSQQSQANAAPGAAPALPGSAAQGSVYILDKSSSDVMAKSNGGSRSRGAAPGQGQGSQEPSEDDPRGGMAAMLTSTKTAARKASFLPNRNFLLAKGAFIDCALQTRLDTTVPGMTACVVTRDIYSDNGKVLLIERGSTVSGEYQANMRQGMARIYVLWNRVKTPNGVVIPLDSPGTDQLGGAGVPGYVDNHFWQRFGGALMLSLVDDVARGVTSQSNSSSDGSQFNFTSTGDATQNMAAEALRNTINIPPTLYRNQGGQVGIYVARDLDFSGVYDVAAE